MTPFFTLAEAQGKVGVRVRCAVDFLDVPRGTTGTVTSACPFGSGYLVHIEWEETTDDGVPKCRRMSRLMYQQWVEEVADG